MATLGKAQWGAYANERARFHSPSICCGHDNKNTLLGIIVSAYQCCNSYKHSRAHKDSLVLDIRFLIHIRLGCVGIVVGPEVAKI